jgi:hypothetical protein
MDDLVAFVRARLDEDELWARAASAPRYETDGPAPPNGAHWVWGLGDNWEHYKPEPLEKYLGEDSDLGRASLVTVEEWPWQSEYSNGRTLAHRVLCLDEEVRTADAAHIVRHDPARVLRNVQGARVILDVVASWTHRSCQDGYYSCSQATEVNGFPADEACADEDRAGEPCDCGLEARRLAILRPLALPYAEHPGYRPEWAA